MRFGFVAMNARMTVQTNPPGIKLRYSLDFEARQESGAPSAGNVALEIRKGA
jgi:hypothetical protein